jgi:SAM-dependent methyltransferase
LEPQGNKRRRTKIREVSYEALAERYDQFFRWQRAVWQRARRELLRDLPSPPRSHCDLGCGTGSTALEFARRGVRVFAVDRSVAMCRLVRRKARRAHLAVRVLQADLRDFRLPETVDLATCEFHSLNHLLREADFRRALRRVRAALRPGGFFFFDCARRAMYRMASAEDRRYESRDLVVTRGYRFDAKRSLAHFDAVWSVRRGARWYRYEEHIPQAPWEDKKVRALLRGEGFEVVVSRDGARFVPRVQARRARGLVTFYLARRV